MLRTARPSTKALLVIALATIATASLWPVLAAEGRVEKSVDLAPGGTLVVEASQGSVSVRGTERSGARVVVTARDADLVKDFTVSVESGPREARVSVKRKSSGLLGSFWGGGGSVQIAVEVPHETAVNVETGGGSIELVGLVGGADVSTSGGSIEIADFEGTVKGATSGGGIELSDVRGEVTVRTSGGGIEAIDVEGKLDVRTSGGSIALQSIAGDLVARTSGGSIKIREAGGSVDAETSGGSVYVRFAAGNAKGGQIETSAGGIRIEIDPQVSLMLDIATSAGSVTSDLPLASSTSSSRTHIVGALGAGGESKLLARASAGSITIGPR